MKLDNIRENIDRIDDELKELFLERMGYSAEVADTKAGSGDAIYKPGREQSMIERLGRGVDDDVYAEYVSFLKAVVRISRQYQYKRLVRYLGTDTGIEGGRARLEIHTKDIASVMMIIADYGIRVVGIESPDDCDDMVYNIDIDAKDDKNNLEALIYQLGCETDKCIVTGGM